MSIVESEHVPSLDLLITLKQASVYCGLSPKSLKIYAAKGRLQAWKVGSEWLTTKAAIDTYLASRDSRGRKPQAKKFAHDN